MSSILVSTGNASRGHEMTPYHAYKGTSEFASILRDMEKGLLPVGTGQPFPVVFQDEEGPQVDPMSPFSQFCTANTSEPKANEIIGPKAFGL